MRSFIAVDLDAPLRKALGRAQDRIRAIAPKLRYVDPATIHLTLKFLGEIDPRRAPEISAALGAVADETRPFDFGVCELGVFSDRGGRVRVLWAGIDDADGALAAFQQRIERALDTIGFPPEQRPFSPHLTLARSRRPMQIPQLTNCLEEEADTRFGAQFVESIVLYESDLTCDGPVHTPLSRHGLRPD